MTKLLLQMCIKELSEIYYRDDLTPVYIHISEITLGLFF